MMEAPKLVISG